MEDVSRGELISGSQQDNPSLGDAVLETATGVDQNIIVAHEQQEHGGLPRRKRRRDDLEDSGAEFEGRINQNFREIYQRLIVLERKSQRFEQSFEPRFEQSFEPRFEPVRGNYPSPVQQAGGASVAEGYTFWTSTNRRPNLAVYTLFSDEDNENAEWTDQINNKSKHDFTTYMEKYLDTYIVRSPDQPDCRRAENGSIRIAVLDTGFYADDEDFVLQGAESRIKLKENFANHNSNDCRDYHGHGTHVTRLLLRFAPEADIYVAKVSNSRSLETANMDQLARALRWAGEHADIINLSFGLGQTCPPATPNANLDSEINRLVRQKKLIFAAASNTGGNGSRPWPASHRGVFCIHATDERGVTNQRMNPTALSSGDNFATLGTSIASYWDGKPRCISGTSFATAVAAAIAANVLDFARRHLAPADADMFARYGVMRALFRNHMTENGNSDGAYHYIKPWRQGLWDVDTEAAVVAEKLKEISIHCV